MMNHSSVIGISVIKNVNKLGERPIIYKSLSTTEYALVTCHKAFSVSITNAQCHERRHHVEDEEIAMPAKTCWFRISQTFLFFFGFHVNGIHDVLLYTS